MSATAAVMLSTDSDLLDRYPADVVSRARRHFRYYVMSSQIQLPLYRLHTSASALSFRGMF